jgi:hypothetical protein
LSKFDFRALAAGFKEWKHRDTELGVSKAAVRAKLIRVRPETMLHFNMAHTGFQEKSGEFRTPEGSEHALLRFPGMGNLWLPGLYHVLAMSKAEFESRAHSNDPDIDAIRRDIRSSNGEILWPENPSDDSLAVLLLD